MAAALAMALMLSAPVRAGTLGEVQDLAGLGARFPEAAYNSIDRTWIVVWVDYALSGVVAGSCRTTGLRRGAPVAVQELDVSGAKVGLQVLLAPGDFGCLGNAAAPSGRRVLTVWEELSGAKHLYSRLYEVGPDCQPACAGKACGDDGCGGSCGACPPAEYCVAGTCEPVAGPADAAESPESDAGNAPTLDAGVSAGADASPVPGETETRGSCGCASEPGLFPLALLAAGRKRGARHHRRS